MKERMPLPGRADRVVLRPLLALAVVAASCGREVRGDPCDEATTVTVTYADQGRRVEIEDCGLLFVDLDPPPRGAWVIMEFPEDILRLEKQGDGGSFRFRAIAPGEGRIVAVARDCPPPTPAADGAAVEVAAAVPPCPGGSPGEDEVDPGMKPPLADGFAITVRVTAG
jgi:hypothetical protein